MPRSGREYDGNPDPDVPPDRAAWSARHPPAGLDGVPAYVRAAHANVAASWVSWTVDGRIDPLPEW
jgi:hypothetical protein